MNQCEETEEGVHPSETPLCGQHDNQTKAQSSVKQQKPDSLVVSVHRRRMKSFEPPRRDFRYYPSSDSKKKVATADGDSVLSLDSGLGSLESLSSDSEKDSFWSSDRRCVSSKERTRSYQHDIDFKKNVPSTTSMFYTNTARWRPDFRDSSSSDSKKDAAADRYSVLSSDSWEKEKTAPPTTQELVVGSSSEIETKSTHLPEAV